MVNSNRIAKSLVIFIFAALSHYHRRAQERHPRHHHDHLPGERSPITTVQADLPSSQTPVPSPRWRRVPEPPAGAPQPHDIGRGLPVAARRAVWSVRAARRRAAPMTAQSRSSGQRTVEAARTGARSGARDGSDLRPATFGGGGEDGREELCLRRLGPPSSDLRRQGRARGAAATAAWTCADDRHKEWRPRQLVVRPATAAAAARVGPRGKETRVGKRVFTRENRRWRTEVHREICLPSFTGCRVEKRSDGFDKAVGRQFLLFFPIFTYPYSFENSVGVALTFKFSNTLL